MDRQKHPHDPTKYPELFQFSKQSFITKDSDSLENLLHQASSLYEEGYLTRAEKHDISKLIRIFLVNLEPYPTD